jgi:SAM-dependent methyltransferase
MHGLILCDKCSTPLTNQENRLLCNKCTVSFATLEDNLASFDDIPEIEGYFEGFMSTVGKLYQGYDRGKFLEALKKVDYWEMDLPNKTVGVTKKYWWEKHLGRFHNKNILDLGCGVHYLVPYWADTNNIVYAIDVCRDEILILKNIMEAVEIPRDRYFLIIGDAEKINFDKKFDVINVSNSLHHMPDRETIIPRLKQWLKDDGVLVIEEANYYWPPRWLVETKIIQPNPIHEYFLRNKKVEEGERGFTYSELKILLNKNGFKIDYNEKDINYFGYFLYHFIKKETLLTRLVYEFDKHVLDRLLPSLLAPFEYVIASKKN